ncbi:MAG: TlpA disulfide reductase family protein [Elusimicrobia bacterium]|nr:TlpA disulfide reductase family protein [Elusimicrobiota bacterium]
MNKAAGFICLIAAVALPAAAEWHSAGDQAGSLAKAAAARISGQRPEPAGSIGRGAPGFALQNVGKSGAERISLKQFRGRVVLLDFWSTLCGPCRAATPHVAELHRKYAAQGLVVIGIDVQESADKVKAYLKEKRVPYPVLLDSDARVANNYGVQAIPSFFIIDAKGAVIWQRVGLKDDMEGRIREALGLGPLRTEGEK